MNVYRNILKVTMVLFAVLMIPASSYTYVPKNYNCTVKDEDDTPGNPSIFSLRGRVELGFNPTYDRACHERDTFLAGESYNIVLQNTITFDNPDDGDSDSNGFNMEVDGGGAAVVIDARTNFYANKCVFILKNTNSIWRNMTIRVHKAEKAFCNAAGNPDTGSTHVNGQNGLIIDADQPSAVCGNGTVEEGEQCEGGQCCDSQCKWKSNGASCNDGDSHTEDDKCNASHECHGTAVPYCGDGNKDPGEDCDGGQCCTATCDFKPEGTSCNDGSLITINDQCNATGECHGTIIVIPICGNGLVESGEACDDGNAVNADGCSACAIDAGYTCIGSPSVCTPTAVCGNSVVEAGEACDGGQCCDASCNFKAAGSVCDDGNAVTISDQCSATHVCAGTPPAGAVCGNGVVEAGEDCEGGQCCDASCHFKAAGSLCDDGNASTTNDQCNANVCAGTPDTTGGGTVTPPCVGGPKVCHPTTGGGSGSGSTSLPCKAGQHCENPNGTSPGTNVPLDGTCKIPGSCPGSDGGCALSFSTGSSASLAHWMLLTVPALLAAFRKRIKKKA